MKATKVTIYQICRVEVEIDAEFQAELENAALVELEEILDPFLGESPATFAEFNGSIGKFKHSTLYGLFGCDIDSAVEIAREVGDRWGDE